MKKSVFICPVCGGEMERDERVYRCGKGHCFDISAKGYVNLLPANAKHSADPGDNKMMVNARANFLNKGYYSHLAEAVEGAALKYYKGGLLLDSGCGEGYYTERVCRAISEKKILPVCTFAGVDISKNACAKAAKRLTGADILCETAAASVFNLPVGDGAVSLLMTMFAPLCREEFERVIRLGGALIMAIPGAGHLMSFKEKIYDEAYENVVGDYGLSGFELLEVIKVSREIHLNNSEDIRSLFAMTPYYYKTGREGHARVEALESLTTNAEFEVIVYKRTER
ncbi:MAG: methyltransferase domain-containing protein [Oscillospiraceae bacterium]|nr:methyltransferase domain-containing protein [Oscillospiraceae bacterium]